MENKNNNRKDTIQKRIEQALKSGRENLSNLKGKTLEEILEEISTYHQELEIQNQELQRVYEELDISKQDYQALFDFAPIGYVVVDTSNTIVKANVTFANMVGEKSEELKNKKVNSFIHPNFQDQYYLTTKKVLKEKNANSILVKLNVKSKEIFAKLECNILKTDNGDNLRLGFVDVTNEVINERQLIDSRERYRAVADYAYHWEYWQDPDERLLYMSPSCERITGYSRFEFFENPNLLEDIIHPDDRHKFEEHKYVAIASGQTRVEHTAEYRITRKNGEVIWIGHACQNIFKEDGTHIGLRATNRDITKRKLAREELKQNVALLNQTQEIAHIGSWELNVETNKLIWSDEIYRIFGIDPQQFKGSYECFLDTVHPDDRDSVNAAYVNSLRDEANTYEIEHRIIRKDNNEVRYVYEKCNHERNDNGRVTRSVGMVQDITERKQKEQKLVISDRIFNYSLDMLCIAGYDGYFKTLNPAWAKTLGWSTEELMKKPWIEFVHPNDREATMRIRTVLVDGEEIFQFENRYVCKDGTYKWLSWNSYPYPKENIMFGVARDVTFRKQAEERLLTSELKLKEQVEEYTALNEELNQSNEELRNVMEDLHDSNQRNSALVSANPDVMFVYDRNGVFLDYHTPSPETLLLKPNDFLNKKANEVLPDFLAEINQNAINALFETGEAQTYSYSLDINKKTHHYDARMVRYGDDKALAIVRDITEQKIAEEKVRQAHETYQGIINSVTESIYIQDEDGAFLEVNNAALKSYGLKRKDLIGKTPEILSAQGRNDLPLIAKMIRKAFKGEPQRFEFWGKRANGTVFPNEVTLTKGTYFGKNVVIAVARDISERKQAEEKLQQSNNNISFLADRAISFINTNTLSQFYAFIAESMQKLNPNAYILVNSVNMDENFFVTKAVGGPSKLVSKISSLLGYDIVGKKFTINQSFLHQASGKLVKIKGGVYEFSLGNLPKSLSKKIEGLLQINSIYGIAVLSNGKIVANVALIFAKDNDITNIETIEAFIKQAAMAYSRIKTQEDLTKSEQRFQLSMEATNDGLWDWNVKNREAYYSPAYYTMLGYEVGGFPTTGSVWKGLVHTDDWERVDEVISKCVNGISDSFDNEFRMKSYSGEWKWIYSRGKVVERDKKGKALRIVGTHVDITQRKDAENEILKRELLLNKIFDVLPIGLWFADEKGKLQRGNPAGVKIWGAEPTVPMEEYGVLKARRLPSGEEIAPDEWALAKTIKYGKTITDELIEIEAFDGKKRVVLNYAAPVIDNKGEMLGAIVVNNDITNLHKAQENLRANEQLLKSISDNMFDLVSLTDLHGNYTFAGASHSILGYKIENLIGTNVLEYVHPDDLPKVKNAFVEFLSNQKDNKRVEYRNRCADGSYLWFETIGRFILDEKGKPKEILFNSRDITERKKIEDALAHSHNLMKYIIEHIRGAVAVHDRNFRYIYVSEQYLTDFNVEDKNIIGKHHYEVFPDLPQKWRDAHQRALKGEVISKDDDPFEMPDGTIEWTRWECRPWYEANGKIGGFVVYTEIITKRKEAEQALRESEERFRSLYENATVGIYRTTPDGRILMANPTLVEMIGYDSFEELAKRNLSQEDYEPEYPREEFQRQIEEKGEVKGLESAWRKKDGSTIYVSESARAVRDEKGKIIYYEGIVEDITERKKAINALVASENRIQSIFRVAPTGIGVIKNRVFMDVNPRLCEMTGYSTDELIGQSALMIYPTKADFDYVGNEKYRQIAEKGTGSVETRWVRKDKSIINVFLSSTPINRKDLSHGVTFTALDITDRKKIEINLRENEEKYRLLFENMTQGFALSEVIVDNHGNPVNYRFITVNPTYEKLTGLKAKDIVGKTIKDVIPDIEPYWIENFGKVGLTGKPKRFENYARKLDKHFDTLVFSPKKGQFAVISSDVTERKKAEEEIAKLSKGIEQSPAIVVITDTDGTIEYVNPKFTKVTGYSLKEAIGENPRILNSGNQSKAFYKNLWDTIKSGKDWQGEMLNKKKDGSTYWEYALISSIKDEGGNIRHFIAIKEDITQRKKIEKDLKEKNEEYLALNEELIESNERIQLVNKDLVHARKKAEESDRLKTAFLANMSHEVRTPMNSIIGFSEFLLRPNVPREKQVFFARILNTSCHQLLSVVNDIIDISKIETGQMDIHQEEVNINNSISRIKEVFIPQATQHQVTLETNFYWNNDRAMIITDTSKIDQIFTNLISNAIKFTEEGSVEIGYTLKGEFIEFYVKDTGIGISPEHHELVFERFKQVEMESTRKYGGTGLGLPISKAFVEMLGGTIWLNSELGKGTTIYFTLPYVPSREIAEQEESPGNEDDIHLNGKTILIAEDETANILYLRELVEDTGAKVIHAQDGKEAVDIVQSNPNIDLILMDIKMPVMNGVDATRLIKKHTNKIPVIALTAYAMSGDKDKYLKAGCDGYLSKPILGDELISILKEFLGKPKKSI
ncbi:MAG: PAS domain S-box protein [Bacteroidales bacterium]